MSQIVSSGALAHMVEQAVCSGASVGRPMPNSRFPIANAISDWELERFRSQVVMALSNLPPSMSVGELKRALSEGRHD